MVVAGRRGGPADVLVRPRTSVRRWTAPGHRHWRSCRRGCSSRGRCCLVFGHDARQRVDAEHPDPRRVHGLAHASGLAIAARGRERRRVGAGRNDRTEWNARVRRPIRPSGHPRDERRQRLYRSTFAASGESGIAAAGASAFAGACYGRNHLGADPGHDAAGVCAGTASRGATRPGGATSRATCRCRTASGRGEARCLRRRLALVAGRRPLAVRHAAACSASGGRAAGAQSTTGASRSSAVARPRSNAVSASPGVAVRSAFGPSRGAHRSSRAPSRVHDHAATASRTPLLGLGSAFTRKAQCRRCAVGARPRARGGVRCRLGLRTQESALASGTYH